MTKGGNRRRAAARSAVLLAGIVAVGGALAAWKHASAADAAAAGGQPEPVEVVTDALATAQPYRNTTTAIGTVLALRSVTLRNELPGTVREVRLVPGKVVEAGELLVALDVSVEEAELRALEAQAELAATTLKRVERMVAQQAASAIELDNVRAELEVAQAQIARTRAIIGRKTIRAPFRALVGVADVHPGQFLDAGTVLTTLQGVNDAAHVDFSVAQSVLQDLGAGDVVEVVAGDGGTVIPARVVAVDSRIDATTRNATVRARIDNSAADLTPGASVRVRVPVGERTQAVVVPVTSLRKGPGGDHVFVLETAENGQTRAHLRRVQSGPVLGDEVVILGGLNAGERVAASGSFKLREAVLVNVSGAAVADAERR